MKAIYVKRVQRLNKKIRLKHKNNISSANKWIEAKKKKSIQDHIVNLGKGLFVFVEEKWNPELVIAKDKAPDLDIFKEIKNIIKTMIRMRKAYLFEQRVTDHRTDPRDHFSPNPDFDRNLNLMAYKEEVESRTE